jgi:hypothetical protein
MFQAVGQKMDAACTQACEFVSKHKTAIALTGFVAATAIALYVQVSKEITANDQCEQKLSELAFRDSIRRHDAGMEQIGYVFDCSDVTPVLSIAHKCINAFFGLFR